MSPNNKGSVSCVTCYTSNFSHVCDTITEMSDMLKIFNFELFTRLSTDINKLNIWLQGYGQLNNAENNMKQKDMNSFFAIISKTIYATSDSIPLIMSHM